MSYIRAGIDFSSAEPFLDSEALLEAATYGEEGVRVYCPGRFIIT